MTRGFSFSPGSQRRLLVYQLCFACHLVVFGEKLINLVRKKKYDFLGGSDGKEFACNAGHLDLISGLGRSPGGGHGYPLQYSCLENPMDREAWGAIIHGVAKSQT